MKYFTFKSSDAQNVIDESGNREYPFQRLPDKYKKNVRKEVWSLSQNSAGLSIRFKTNSKKVIFKWSVKNDFKMNHMTDAGIKGLDIYECVDNIWLYHSTGLPNASKNEHSIKFKNTINKTLCLYLPLYDTITDLKIGIDDFSSLTFMKNKNKPIVFYGTSITQGGCASRPGMAHTNIISRNFAQPCINLGFDGNGHLEMNIGNILSKIDASCYVIDCLPNVNINQLKSNIIPLVKSIRDIDKGYHCPIIFIEQPLIHDQYIDEDVKEKNNVLASQIKGCNKLGFKEIYLIDQKDCLGSDHEATVDGVHYNDIGFQRFSEHIMKNIESIL